MIKIEKVMMNVYLNFMIQSEQSFLINESILFDVRLSPIDRIVYFMLSSLVDEEGTCSPTYQTIKSYLGISKASVSRSIKHLKKLKLLDVYRKYDRNIYHFH